MSRRTQLDRINARADAMPRRTWTDNAQALEQPDDEPLDDYGWPIGERGFGWSHPDDKCGALS